MNPLALAASIIKSVNPTAPKTPKQPKTPKAPKQPKEKKAPKVRKGKKIVEPTVVIVSSGDAFCARSTGEKIRAAFQVKPSPKAMTFPTPFGKIEVAREEKKGSQAAWFSTDEKGIVFKGDKKSVRENVAEMITISHRLFKMGRTMIRPQVIVNPENIINVPE